MTRRHLVIGLGLLLVALIGCALPVGRSAALPNRILLPLLGFSHRSGSGTGNSLLLEDGSGNPTGNLLIENAAGASVGNLCLESGC